MGTLVGIFKKYSLGAFQKIPHGYLGGYSHGYFLNVPTRLFLKMPHGYLGGYFLKVPTPYLLGKRQVHCFRALNELPMDLLGNFTLAPSVPSWISVRLFNLIGTYSQYIPTWIEPQCPL